MSRRAGFFLAAAIGIGAVALAVVLVSLAPEPERRTPPPDVPFVQTANAVAGSDVIPVYGAGTVRPSAEVDIAPQVDGRIVWVNPAFRSGGRMQAGEVIFRIEEADYVHQLREAEAALSARESEYLQAREEAAIARDEYARYAKRQPNAGSPAPASPLILREPQLQAAQAALERDEARVASAELVLTRTRLSAPLGRRENTHPAETCTSCGVRARPYRAGSEKRRTLPQGPLCSPLNAGKTAPAC